MRAVKKKVYEKSAKGYVSAIDTNAASSVSLPKDDKKNLAIVMPYLLFQVFIPFGKAISIEIAVTDATLTKRRLNFGKGTKGLVVTEHHSRIPSASFKTGSWVNLCIDVRGFFNHCYPEEEFQSIDGITLTAFCLCRKIFALRSPIIDTSDLDLHTLEIPNIDKIRGEDLPKHLQFKYGVNFFNQLVSPEKIGSEPEVEDPEVV